MEIHTVPYDNGGLCGPVVSLQVANSGYNTEGWDVPVSEWVPVKLTSHRSRCMIFTERETGDAI